ncbi:MAG: glycine cleavage T C-terminal barrel domain-containing protein [Tepidisphaeraceae bacterium]
MSDAPASPLLDTFRNQPLTDLASFGSIEIVLTFGEPQAEYAAVRKACGLMDQPHRGLLELTGKDRHAFLGNLVSNRTWDVASKTALVAGTGVYAFFLNLKGRVVADLNVLELTDRTLIETDVRLIPMLRTVFDKYLFAEKVKLTDLTSTHVQFALLGPGSIDVLKDFAGVDAIALPSLGSIQTSVDDVPIVAWRDDSLLPGAPALQLVVPREAAKRLWTTLVDRFGGTDDKRDYGKRRLRPVGWAVFNTCRIEAGRPILGIDYEPAEPSLPGKKKDADAEDAPASRGVLPVETGQLDRAVDFNKGCYLGQEIVARLHARKQVPRKIVGLKMLGEELPTAGAEVFDTAGTQVGIVTSSTVSPILSNAALCLALVKKPNFEIGTTLRVSAEGALRPASVVETPFN